MPGRLPGLDRFRGLIMALMALDHAGLLLGGASHLGDERWGGPYPSGATTAAFLARLASHLCAPGFCFLMGAGMALFAADRASRGWSRGSVVGRFALRGLLLVAAQFLLENPAWGLPWGEFWVGYFGVLAMLGLATLVAAPLVFQSAPRLLLLAVAGVLGGLALVPAPQVWTTPVPLPLRLLYLPGANAGGVLVNYSLLPWLGVVLAGMAFGRSLVGKRTPGGRDARRPWRLLTLAGAALLALFPILRLVNDGMATLRPLPFDSWRGFLSLVKYPPSLAFLALTLGAGFLLVRLLQADGPRLGPPLRPLSVFGAAPLFFYVVHLWLFSLTRLLIDHDVGLADACLYWLAGLVALYPLCLRYAAFRRARPPGSIWRLL